MKRSSVLEIITYEFMSEHFYFWQCKFVQAGTMHKCHQFP